MYTSEEPEAVPCAATTVKKLSRVLGRSYDQSMAKSGINITQMAVLRCIGRRSGEALSRVADELEMDRTSLYRAVVPMEREGWVRIAHRSDGRSRTASLTKKGEQVTARARKEWERVQSRIVDAFGEARWKRLAKDLNQLAECAEAP